MVDIGANAQLYLTNDIAASIENITAEDWAKSQWFPSLFSVLVVAFHAQFLIAYEHVVHFPDEIIIWRRLCRKQTRIKARLAWLTIWLRYATLAFGIILIIMMWDRTTLDDCRNKIFPTAFAFAVVVSISTGYVSACRSRTIAKAALSTPAFFNLVQMICLACLLGRFASLIVTFSLQIQVTKALEDRATLNGLILPVSCFARATPRSITVDSGKSAPIRSLYALLAIVCGIDSIIAVITFSSIAKLRKSVLTQSHLLDELFRNSIQYFPILISVDLFCLIFLCVTKQANIIALAIASNAILTIRILIKEQECIIAHSRSAEEATRSAWPIHGERGQAEKTGEKIHEERHARFKDGGCRALPIESKAGNCRACRHDGYAQTKRRGAGLTDIERITIVDHARSIDGPYATVSDMERKSKIAAWTRQTAGAMIDEEKIDVEKDCEIKKGEQEIMSLSSRLLRDARHRFSLQVERPISPLAHIGRVVHAQYSRSHSTHRHPDDDPYTETSRNCKTVF